MPQKRRTRKVNTKKVNTKNKTNTKKTGITIENVIWFLLFVSLAIFVFLSNMDYCGPVGDIVKRTILSVFGTVGYYFYMVLIAMGIICLLSTGNALFKNTFILLLYISIISFVSANIVDIDNQTKDLFLLIKESQDKAINALSLDTNLFSSGIISTAINFLLFNWIHKAGIIIFHGFFIVLFFLLSFGLEGMAFVKNLIVGILMFIPNIIKANKERKREDIKINIENERKLTEIINRSKTKNKKFISNTTADELLSMGIDPYSTQELDYNNKSIYDHGYEENKENKEDKIIQMNQDLEKVKIIDSSKFVYDTTKINVDVENIMNKFFRPEDIDKKKDETKSEQKDYLLNEMKDKSINQILQDEKDITPGDFFYEKQTDNAVKEDTIVNNNEEETAKETNTSSIPIVDLSDGIDDNNTKDYEMTGSVSANYEKKPNTITEEPVKIENNPFEEKEKEQEAYVEDKEYEEDNIEDKEVYETEADTEEVVSEENIENDNEDNNEDINEENDEEYIEEDDDLEEVDSDDIEDDEDFEDEVEETDEEDVEDDAEEGAEEIPDTNEIQKLSTDNKYNKQLDDALQTSEDKEVKEQVKKTRTRKTPRKYKFPPQYLLKKSEKQKNVDREYLKETAQTLQSSLAQFGVGAKVTRVTVGPTVTRYELLPSQGVRVKKFIELQDDIKLAMAATDIRIEAPIPGKSAVGIEVPNRVTKPVLLGDLISSSDFRNSKSNLSVCMGRDIAGNNIICDITSLPHLLVAGSTGSGKSVCINSIIMSLIYKSSPEDVKMILVDPKRVELQVYNEIPHLLIPVVVDPKRAAAALNWAVNEMVRRYNLISKERVRDIDAYNKKVEEYNKELEANEENGVINENEESKEPKEKKEKLASIVIIIDEFSDLMMVASKEVENAISRLAQLARACGIYLIIATQRPTVNVISGLIKANVPGRIAFAVSSGIDSKTIIDQYGAEKLIGKGDMLYSPTGIPKPIRVQGCLVTDEEIKRVVDFVKDPNVTMDEEIDKEITETSNFDNEEAKEKKQGGLDEYFVEAGKLIIQTKIASSGFLQRKLQIGFNRASRILDQLAENGVVTEQDGKKPREILMELNEFLDTFDV